MNLYTSAPKPVDRTLPKINSHRIYLASLSNRDSELETELKLITTIRDGERKLYVLSSAGKYYLSSNFMIGVGIENILYSSENCARVIKYGQKYILKSETV